MYKRGSGSRTLARHLVSYLVRDAHAPERRAAARSRRCSSARLLTRTVSAGALLNAPACMGVGGARRSGTESATESIFFESLLLGFPASTPFLHQTLNPKT